ncbi:MAG: NTP transferase domain-containing protein [Nitrospina sp.]|jgi:UDP-N-acetylglucosamine diphosphorylase/glucosamine-1-phosphate N-acetyltransferase|nr:NTP transferase domain-containing protein [Nitrospina sp.]MBT6716451.1 NTP transferase domain-containing protein [Nitrospina sp.]
MQEQDLAVIILAAGKGTRMKTPLAKVLIPVAGKPTLEYVLNVAERLKPSRTIVVVGHQADRVQEMFSNRNVEFVLQKEQLGTGHAARQTETALAGFEGNILILCGDMPCIKAETLEQLLAQHKGTAAKCSVLTLKSKGRHDFGRIIRDAQGGFLRIVEQRDASAEEKRVDEFNSGVYCFDKRLFFKALSCIGNSNVQEEFYLTDTLEYSMKSGFPVASVQTEDTDEILGINSPDDLKRAEQLLDN